MHIQAVWCILLIATSTALVVESSKYQPKARKTLPNSCFSFPDATCTAAQQTLITNAAAKDVYALANAGVSAVLGQENTNLRAIVQAGGNVFAKFFPPFKKDTDHVRSLWYTHLLPETACSLNRTRDAPKSPQMY